MGVIMAMPEEPEAAGELRDLLARARRGDTSCRSELGEVLDACPEIWEHAGDLSAHARDAWIEATAGSDLLLAESIARRIDALRADLGGSTTSPLERLLIDRVAITWVQSAYFDAVAARARDAPIKLAAFARTRQDVAHKSHLAAIAALAQIRRLLAPGPAVRPSKPPAGSRPPLTVFGEPATGEASAAIRDPSKAHRGGKSP